METEGWVFLVKTSEGAASLGRGDTPVFPLEPIQPRNG